MLLLLFVSLITNGGDIGHRTRANNCDPRSGSILRQRISTVSTEEMLPALWVPLLREKPGAGYLFRHRFKEAVVNSSFVASESCFYQRCLGCYEQDIIGPGSRLECHPSNWVTSDWMHNMGHVPPTTDSKVPIEYRCLKMVATPDDKSSGNTVDIIRGCVPRLQIDSVCASLAAVERARGHSNMRCHICKYNDCNSSVRLRSYLPSYTILGSFLLFNTLR